MKVGKLFNLHIPLTQKESTDIRSKKVQLAWLLHFSAFKFTTNKNNLPCGLAELSRIKTIELQHDLRNLTTHRVITPCSLLLWKMPLLLFQINHLGPDLSSLVRPISVLLDKDFCWITKCGCKKHNQREIQQINGFKKEVTLG